MFKSILVGIDDSKSSEEALSLGVDLANKFNANLKGIYIEDIGRLLVWDPVALAGASIGTTSNIPQPLPTEVQVEIEQEFVREASKIKKNFDEASKDLKTKKDFSVVRGRVDEILVNESKTVDLVIIGRRGKTYPEESREPGPIVENLLREVTRPVIVTPPEPRKSSRIVIAYDGSKSSQRALVTGIAFAEILNTKVIVITVSNNKKFASDCLSEAKEYLSPYKLETIFVDVVGPHKPWEGIIKEGNDFEAGFIVMGAYGDSRLKEFIFGSTTKDVLMKSRCPVLLTK